MVWCGVVWRGMVWYGVIRHGTVWYRMVWYCMVWHGLIRYGTAQYGLVRCGVVWSGLGSLYGMAYVASHGPLLSGVMWHGNMPLYYYKIGVRCKKSELISYTITCRSMFIGEDNCSLIHSCVFMIRYVIINCMINVHFIFPPGGTRLHC